MGLLSLLFRREARIHDNRSSGLRRENPVRGHSAESARAELSTGDIENLEISVIAEMAKLVRIKFNVEDRARIICCKA